MVPKKVQSALNEQLNLELQSSYDYLAMSAYCEHQHFPGFAHWLRQQSVEEREHGMKLYAFLAARDCRVMLDAIPQPTRDYDSIHAVFQQTLKQEQQVSARINALYKLAWEEEAFAALVELEWFIAEQVSEEQTARQILAQLEMVKDDPAALLDLDRQLGARTS